MALLRSKRDEIPEDAVKLTEEEAVNHQWKIISSWEKSQEVWSLRHGPGALAILSGATGIFLNNHYRSKLRLGRYGQMASYIPIVAMPAMMSMVGHKLFVQRHILLDNLGECPLCLQVRAACFQTSLGFLYPLIMGPAAALSFATRYYTYDVPSITQRPMDVFQMLRRFTKPILPVLGTVLAGHAVISMYLTYKEMEQNYRVQIELRKIERRYEDEHGDAFSSELQL